MMDRFKHKYLNSNEFNKLFELYDAVKSDNRKAVNDLLKSGVNPRHGDWAVCGSVLKEACKYSCVEIVRRLVTNQRAPTDRKYVAFMSNCVDLPVCGAVEAGNVDIVRVLVTEAVVAPNLRDGAVLSEAVMSGNVDMVKVILEAGADPNITHAAYRWPPLVLAGSAGRTDICRLLLNTPTCDVNAYFPDRRIKRSQTVLTPVRLLEMPLVLPFAPDADLSYIQLLIEEYGADLFLNGGSIFHRALIYGGHFLDYLLERAYSAGGDARVADLLRSPCVPYTHRVGPTDRLPLLYRALAVRSFGECEGLGSGHIKVLLRWGANNPQCRCRHHCLRRHLPASVFCEAAHQGRFNIVALLAHMYPQCLQEEWLVQYNSVVPHFCCTNAFVRDLAIRRRRPPILKDLCRSRIFEQLGVNPMAKAARLPLPPRLIRFVQFEDKLLMPCYDSE